jgi:hypothetical protein
MAAMRNDARPIGEEAHDQSPLDERDTVAHDRQSHIINKRAEEDQQRDDHDPDPVMPANDSTVRTKI